MANEADTCRALMTSQLQAASWKDDPHSIANQRIDESCIVVHRNKTMCRRSKRADYLVEGLRLGIAAAIGMQQSNAETLGVKFAHATKVADIIEIGHLSGLLRKIALSTYRTAVLVTGGIELDRPPLRLQVTLRHCR